MSMTPCNTVRVALGLRAVLYNALVDTGATVSVIKSDIVRRNGITIEPLSRYMKSNFVTADNSPLVVQGQCTVPVRIGDFVSEVTCIVVQKLRHALILGMDFLKEQSTHRHGRSVSNTR